MIENEAEFWAHLGIALFGLFLILLVVLWWLCKSFLSAERTFSQIEREEEDESA